MPIIFNSLKNIFDKPFINILVSNLQGVMLLKFHDSKWKTKIGQHLMDLFNEDRKENVGQIMVDNY